MTKQSIASSRKPRSRTAHSQIARSWIACLQKPALLELQPTDHLAMSSPTRGIGEISVPQQIAQVAAMRMVHAAFSSFPIRENELRRLQLEIARIPAPPFGESARAQWLRSKFAAIGFEEIAIDELGNVVAVSPGRDHAAPAVAITAHLDTVFPPSTDIAIHEDRDRIYGPGVSDNAAGVTALLAVAMAMREAQIHCEVDVVFIGNVGEEGEGDLRGIRHIFETSRWGQRIGYTVVIDGSG